MRTLILSVSLLLAGATTVDAQQVVFVARHAERADAGGMTAPAMAADPELSEAGKARARVLAAMLKDAKITAIFTTEYKRTRQTAEPLAQALGIRATVVPARDPGALLEKLKSAAGNVLVIGHSNTVGDTISRLGVTEPVKVEDSEYDNLFVVVRGVNPTLVRLHFQ